MSLKFFLLAVLIATPALASSEVHKLGFKNENNVIESVNKLVEAAKHVIAETIEQGREALLEILHNIEKVIYESEKKVLEKVETLIYEIKQKLEHAKQLGKDSTECVLQQKEKIEKLNEATIVELRKCLGNIVAELTKLFEELVEALNKVNDRLLALIDDFYACTNWTCKADIGKKIAEEVLNVNGVMGDTITHFLAIIRENKEVVRVCVSNNMDSFKLELAKIADELEECLNQ